MSIPAFAWALEQGAALKLLAADRLVLVYLADLANGARVCWPSQETIMRFTGLAPKTVRAAIRRLGEAQLIRVEASPGKLPRYHILRPTPANGAGVEADNPGKSYHPTPANGAGVHGATPVNRTGVTPAPFSRTPAPFAQTPVNGAPEPSYTQEEPKKGARERAEAEDLKSRNGMGTPPSAVEQTTTTACGQQTEAETPPVTDEQMAAQLAALAAQTASRFQTNYPPRLSQFTRNEQHDLTAKPVAYQAKPIPPEQLAAMRRLAQIRPVHVDA